MSSRRQARGANTDSGSSGGASSRLVKKSNNAKRALCEVLVPVGNFFRSGGLNRLLVQVERGGATGVSYRLC